MCAKATPTFATTTPQKQSGITLILVLIFTVTLAVIGVVGMRQAMTVERIAANDRDRSLAFQAAESALREGVAQITAGTASGLSSGYYGTRFSAGGSSDFWRTQTTSLTENTACTDSTTLRFKWSGCSANASASSKYNNSAAPQYVIERMPDVAVTGASGNTGTETWYRVTARATGGSNQADVILQVMYCKLASGSAQSTSPTCH